MSDHLNGKRPLLGAIQHIATIRRERNRTLSEAVAISQTERPDLWAPRYPGEPEYAPPSTSERELVLSDLSDILNALGLGDHARPDSPHEVVQREILPTIRALRGRSS